jgi:hypothetical protein
MCVGGENRHCQDLTESEAGDGYLQHCDEEVMNDKETTDRHKALKRIIEQRRKYENQEIDIIRYRLLTATVMVLPSRLLPRRRLRSAFLQP